MFAMTGRPLNRLQAGALRTGSSLLLAALALAPAESSAGRGGWFDRSGEPPPTDCRPPLDGSEIVVGGVLRNGWGGLGGWHQTEGSLNPEGDVLQIGWTTRWPTSGRYIDANDETWSASGEQSVPTAALGALLEAVRIPMGCGEAEPVYSHTDDYPSSSAELWLKDGRRLIVRSASNVSGGAPWNVAIADYVGAIHVESKVPAAFAAIAGGVITAALAARRDPDAAGAKKQARPSSDAPKARRSFPGYDPTPRPSAWLEVPPLYGRTESVSDAIRTVLSQMGPQVKACWAANGGADLEPIERDYGEVVFGFTVNGEGRVAALTVGQDTTGSPGLADCVEALIAPLRFRALGRGAEVRVDPLRARFVVRQPNL